MGRFDELEDAVQRARTSRKEQHRLIAQRCGCSGYCDNCVVATRGANESLLRALNALDEAQGSAETPSDATGVGGGIPA